MLAFAIIALGIAMAAAAIYWSYRRKRAGEVRAIERVYREEDRAQERERRNA
jgi:LPXTG-motif cell wall-anchored protein